MYPMATSMNRSTDEFIRHFSARMSHLSDPILREVLDPLVIDAQSFSSTTPNGGQTIVGVVESQLLRASPNQKYALCVFIDALCRARSAFPFKIHFAQNLERIFSVSFFPYTYAAMFLFSVLHHGDDVFSEKTYPLIFCDFTFENKSWLSNQNIFLI